MIEQFILIPPEGCQPIFVWQGSEHVLWSGTLWKCSTCSKSFAESGTALTIHVSSFGPKISVGELCRVHFERLLYYQTVTVAQSCRHNLSCTAVSMSRLLDIEQNYPSASISAKCPMKSKSWELSGCLIIFSVQEFVNANICIRNCLTLPIFLLIQN